MKKRISYEIEKSMDDAIIYLSHHFNESGHNSKPVILHSIRVGMTLFSNGYSKDIVIAGLLHDIIEDTDLSETELRSKYGNQVTDIVCAATFNPLIETKIEREKDVFLRCKRHGFGALIVKCADILDNIDYFVPTRGYEELAKILIEKYHLFLSISKDVLEREEIYKQLCDKVLHAEHLMDEFNNQ